ncbi:uncharacterized protein DEA37_0011007 [Paragonimus westermani]|uniref:UBA domain-containing protein n=1 Tax=Paragonimus westermani TaxID=34504 RepID=A0A5J4NRL7_9TREM|nr:uncharacterized protein DEA37_0011007 [Paragonimus westermani]
MTYLRVKITRLDDVESVTSKYIAGLDPDQTVGSLIPQILCPDDDLSGLDIKCIYYGELLDANKKLSDYDIDNYSILQFVIKRKVALAHASGKYVVKCGIVSATPCGLREVSQLMANLYWILRSGQLDKLTDLLSSRSWLEQAITRSPALGHEPVAYSILRDPKMLNVLLRDKQCTDRLITLYPCMVHVLHLGVETIFGSGGDSCCANKSTPRSTHRSTLSTHTRSHDYTVDQDLENDTEEDTDAGSSQRAGTIPTIITPYEGIASSEQASQLDRLQQGPFPFTNRVRPSAQVSRHQLQAAIAQAQGLLAGSASSSQRRSSPQHGSAEGIQSSGSAPVITSPSPRRITLDALSQAIASAGSRQDRPATPPNSDQSTIEMNTADRWATQLARLAEMGFTDELVARQALESANGDLDVAIQLLLG